MEELLSANGAHPCSHRDGVPKFLATTDASTGGQVEDLRQLLQKTKILSLAVQRLLLLGHVPFTFELTVLSPQASFYWWQGNVNMAEFILVHRPQKNREASPLKFEKGHFRGYLWFPRSPALVADVVQVIKVPAKSITGLFDYVEFTEGEVMFSGTPDEVCAYTTENAPSTCRVGQVDRVGDRELAYTGLGGLSASGDLGIAISGDKGLSMAGAYGKAFAGNDGSALVGPGGRAWSKENGYSIAGEKGFADAGEGGYALAGLGGHAFVQDGGRAQAGLGGCATSGRGGTSAIPLGARAQTGVQGQIQIYDSSGAIIKVYKTGIDISSNVRYHFPQVGTPEVY